MRQLLVPLILAFIFPSSCWSIEKLNFSAMRSSISSTDIELATGLVDIKLSTIDSKRMKIVTNLNGLAFSSADFRYFAENIDFETVSHINL